jgi:hypothetical protein
VVSRLLKKDQCGKIAFFNGLLDSICGRENVFSIPPARPFFFAQAAEFAVVTAASSPESARTRRDFLKLFEFLARDWKTAAILSDRRNGRYE